MRVPILVIASLLCATPALAQQQSWTWFRNGEASSSPLVPVTPLVPLPVTNTPGGTQDVNLTKVAGAAVNTGSGTAAGSIRVELPTNGTGVVGLNAGSAIIGNIRIDQTTPGTTNGVQLTAGSAVVGNVRIDQTTPGTTNGVQVNAALPAGSAIIGNVRVDQTTPGTTNGVQVNAALPAGTNNIGKVDLIGTTTITPVVSASAEASHVLKGSAGSLWSVYATNLTSTAGFLVVTNTTTAPVDGAITPLDCVFLPANGTASIDYGSGPAAAYSTGITATLTSAVTCFTKTTGTITGFIKGATQ